MFAHHHDSDVLWRLCSWTLSLLALLGLIACGASDQDATATTPAGASQTTAGQPQPPTAIARATSAPTAALNPTQNPALVPATVLPAAPSTAAAIAAWERYRNDQGGYSIAYPTGWSVREQNGADGSFVATFTPAGGGTGVTVIAQAGAPNAAEPSDLPNTRCRPVTIGGLSGTRCFDTVAFSTSTILAGPSRTFIITTTGKRMDEQTYQGFVDSFAPL